MRELLCPLELPYFSIPFGRTGNDQQQQLPVELNFSPVLVDDDRVYEGAKTINQHLWNTYRDPDGRLPKWWNGKPSSNLGRSGSFGVGAYTAFPQGRRAFVPPKALE